MIADVDRKRKDRLQRRIDRDGTVNLRHGEKRCVRDQVVIRLAFV